MSQSLATWTTGTRPKAPVFPVFSHQGAVGFSSVTEADAFFWSLVEDIESGACGPDAWVGWDEFLVTPTRFICTSSVVEDLRAERETDA